MPRDRRFQSLARNRTPRTADGKADFSGTWMHELTSPAEMKRLFGAVIDEEIPHTLLADADIFEAFCENEKDRLHIQNANPR